ncbi:hypothetical protein PACILC2_43820 [Paenibacillus cisolokensis]|uniref:Uncharacterized protein n=1 Tax=Paenibacillus cisolokensis TaxID=1658519 RepID=A0ABQ4NC74_9BACL|nr:hypothetical protein PACILC2_43820 [Paenibacillus cisolokensis]
MTGTASIFLNRLKIRRLVETASYNGHKKAGDPYRQYVVYREKINDQYLFQARQLAFAKTQYIK